MRRRRRPGSLRTRLFLAITAIVLASVAVTLAVGVVLTRRSLQHEALQALARQVDLADAQRRALPGASAGTSALGRFLATEQVRLAILSPTQAELLLPSRGAAALRAGRKASGTVEIRGERYLYAARLSGPDALVLLRSARKQSADWSPFLLGLAIAALVGALLAALAALLLARAVARPLAHVAHASRRLADGHHGGPLPVEGPSETRSLATAFNELSAELQRAQDAERAFLLSVSHELKTPLTAIRGHAEGLADGVVDGAAAAEVIEREAQRLERLVHDLLDLARLRRRSFAVDLHPVDLGELALETAMRYEVQAREYGVELGVEIAPGAGAIADAGRTVQALSNLVENALRCAPRGGEVRITASPGRLEVADDGPGLGDADPARVFERYYLWQHYREARPVGTGLGLAIVGELASAMGGRATVESGAGGGCTFVLHLSLAPPRCVTAERPAGPPGRDGAAPDGLVARAAWPRPGAHRAGAGPAGAGTRSGSGLAESDGRTVRADRWIKAEPAPRAAPADAPIRAGAPLSRG